MQLQYLRHLISSNGIQPLPQKLESINNMPASSSPKEVKQFLGLAGYYSMFVPWFSDLSIPCHQAQEEGCVVQVDQEMSSLFSDVEGCTLHIPHTMVSRSKKTLCTFQDANKYGWAKVLTQPYEEIDELTPSNADTDATPEKSVIHHPVTYISDLFRGSQLNRAPLT